MCIITHGILLKSSNFENSVISKSNTLVSHPNDRSAGKHIYLMNLVYDWFG